MDVKSILERIKKFYNIKEDKELAKFLGVTPQNIYDWKKRGTIKIDILLEKCSEMDLNYLLRGESLYDYQKRKRKLESLVKKIEEIEAENRALLQKLQELPEEDRRFLEKLILSYSPK